ncbi:MAG: pantoate--beta-alanine ligase [Deltaproteobacteria bacterium]|nr:pantoate--beta-alanine ligase [Deltaproteobacteria bacterium]MBW1930304.1 pantoate--beta-alanine ligase [Deltaproteobacteria bacterium]MBW2025269.1 pantoate--beta-alanine ligase [Deltaproteobacteria bacterium]MBW2125292.1 pantoate--beta-alanine ligase [Deltaproteobacteria bacterium]
MKIIETVREMQSVADAMRSAGHTIALVPTMGYLHEAHLELMRVGKRHANKLIISIFVNPTQFGPSEDYERYPRDPEGDLEKARSVGVDIVFMPPVEEMYPEGFQTTVKVEKLTQHLCGLSRPGHFDGVTTVVCKLFNITKPHIAIFGQKDYQQLAVISRMAMDLNMDIQIIGVPTVREADGLAMSSRNAYLTQEQRPSALSLKKSLELADEMLRKGETDAKAIVRAVEALIKEHPFTEIDYVSICDPVTLEDMDRIDQEALLALAVKVGHTRLIDNQILKRK